jgi:hypothetical protein
LPRTSIRYPGKRGTRLIRRLIDKHGAEQARLVLCILADVLHVDFAHAGIDQLPE